MDIAGSRQSFRHLVIHESPLTDLAAAIRRREVTAREATAHYLDRSRRLQPELNAYTEIADGALEKADAIDEEIRLGHDPGPLGGVPIAIKDLIDQNGVTTTCGSGFYRHRAERSATVVRRLEDAGAIIIGRTGLHEFAFGFSSENDWFGPVRNPWDTDTSPGGSSGGSAVAVAAGLTAGAIGTDTGGSVRVPAALCGVTGLKVTHGRVPLTGVFPLASSLDTVGPLGRTAEDVEALYEVMAGHDPGRSLVRFKSGRTPGPDNFAQGARGWSPAAVGRRRSDDREGQGRLLGSARSSRQPGGIGPRGPPPSPTAF